MPKGKLAILLLGSVALLIAEEKSRLLFSFEHGEDLSQLQLAGVRVFRSQGEAADGRYQLVVNFRKDGEPRLTLPSGAKPWDWREFGAVTLHARNPQEEALAFTIEVKDAAGAQTRGRATIRSRAAVAFALPLNVPDPLEMGMRGEPAIPGFRLAAADRRKVDLSRVASVSIFLSKPEKPRRLLLDNVRLIPGVSYERIVDRLGQFALDNWPGKMQSEDELPKRRAAEEAELAKSPTLPDRDQYGGWTAGPKLESTGFFRAAKHNGRWWLVTPEGHLFLSFGVNSLNTTEGDTVTEGRESMFRWLPPKGDPLASHFRVNREWEALGLKIKHHLGLAFNFYSANLQRKYGKDWFEPWAQTTLARMRAWGFNTIGNWSDPRLYEAKKAPYVVTIDTWPAASPDAKAPYAVVASGNDYWRKMTDPFDPAFAVALDRAVRAEALPRRDDPWCLGYFVDNELSWGTMRDERSRFGLALGALELGAGSPAKRAFVDRLKSQYGEISILNDAWSTKLNSWQALLDTPFKPPEKMNDAMKEDLRGLVKEFALRYFRTVRDTLKKHDPNHLYLGARFAWYTTEAVDACGEICDLVTFNIYRPRVVRSEWKVLDSIDKPVLIGEFHMGALDRGMFHTGLVASEDQADRSRMYQEYVRSVVDHPLMVGCHYFKYADEPLTGRPGDGENYSIGLVTVTDTPYPEFIEAAKAVHAEAYKRRAR